MNQYETVFILTPVLSDEQMKEAVKKYQKKSTGFYQLIEYKSEGNVIADVETELKRDERILRFLTVKLDKHAIAYNEKKRKKAEAATEEAQA